MALRVPWDKEEVALLIDAYIRVKNKEISRQEAVAEVSKLLRNRATASGLEIDSVFRNINGISMQMTIIGGLIDEKPSSLHSASKLFLEITDLYKTNRVKFDEILMKAKGECVMQPNVQEKFFSWLAERVSSAQLSDFYMVCKDIDEFCVRRHILAAPLFETTDVMIIRRIPYTMKQYQILKFKDFRWVGKMHKVLAYYEDFLKENSLDNMNVLAEKPFQEKSIQKPKYVKNVQAIPTSCSDNSTLQEEYADIGKRRKEFISWAEKQNMDVGDILGCLSDISKTSTYANKHGFIVEESLLAYTDANQLENILKSLHKDDGYITLNMARGQGPDYALQKLILFCKDSADVETISEVKKENIEILPSETVEADNSQATTDKLSFKERYSKILEENFTDGFRPDSVIDRNRFRMYYEETYEEELAEEDKQLVRKLQKTGTLRDGRIYAKDETEQINLIEDISDTVVNVLKGKASCMYLECLFEKYQEELADKLHIYSMEALENTLFSSGQRSYFKRYNYLAGYDKEPSLKDDVVEYMKHAHLPVTYDTIKAELWYFPLDKIKHALVMTPGIVNVAPEAYLYARNLPVSEGELQKISEIIYDSLLQRDYISDTELMQLLEEHCPSVMMNTQEYPTWGLRNALAYLLKDKFAFTGAIISDKHTKLNMAEVYKDFCRRSERITVDELKAFAKELNTIIYWEAVYGEMVRVSQQEFVHRNLIRFDVERTDLLLDELIQESYVPLKTINLFLHFPAISVPWNSFVLESYIANYSQKFHLLHAGFTGTDCCGAIVRNDSGISEYKELLIDVLAQNPSWSTTQSALQLLVDMGFQQRRSYADIEYVTQAAKARMEINN